MKKLKAYITQPAKAKSKDIFEHAQIDLTYDLTFAFGVLYALMLIGLSQIETSVQFDFLNYISAFGIPLTFLILRKRASHFWAGMVFWITGFITSNGMVLLAANTSDADLQFGVWHSFSIILAFSLLGKKWGLINALYMIVLTVLIALNHMNSWNLFDVGYDRGPDIDQDPIPVAIPLLATTYIMFQTIRTRNKAQKMISDQKDLEKNQRIELERKNLEITDSITYAKRIQSALLPNTNKWNENLPNSFVVYLPKDIVAGDFYWMEPFAEASGSKGVLFAAADCTGHGVPGAMVSVVCYNALNRSVREFGLTDPAKILDKTRELVMAEFAQSEEGVKDGMDIALCSLNGNELKYSGAHNHLWLLKKGETEIQEFKADKQPIGNFYNPQPFRTSEIRLDEGDQFFIFSDGFADQFGGERGKKYKAKRFRTFLASIGSNSSNEQESLIIEEFNNWKGEIEQLDDICVIGVKI